MTKFSFPKSLTRLQPVDRDGRPQLEVGRPSRSTDVHSVHAFVHWRSGRLTRSTDRELLLSGKPRSTGSVDRQRDCCLFQRLGRPKPQRSEKWPLAVDRPVDRQFWQTPTASFSSPINLGVWALCWKKILSGLWASFSHFIKRVFSTKLRANTFNQKGSFYQEC